MTSANPYWVMAQALGGQTIGAEFEQLMQSARAGIEAKRTALEEALTNAKTLEIDLPHSGEHTSPKVDDIVLTSQTMLAAADKELADAERAFHAFRLLHGKVELPSTPSPLATSLNLALMTFVESGINASFFLSAHMAASPISALLTSTLISGTNVAFSACAGFFIGRWMAWGLHTRHPEVSENRRPRWVANALFGGFVAAAAGLHLTVGLIRSQESLHHVSHSVAAYQELLTTPESLMLVIAGSCMSAFAFYKGKHGFTDPYPRYSTMQETVYDFQDQRLEAIEDAEDAIQERFDQAAKTIKASSSDRRKLVGKYNRAVQACQAARQALETAVSEAEANLRDQVAAIADLYSGALSKTATPGIDELAAACDLSSSLHYELPVELPMPDTASALSDLQRAREQALERLALTLGSKADQ